MGCKEENVVKLNRGGMRGYIGKRENLSHISVNQ